MAEVFTIVPIATVLSIATSLSPFMEQATKVPASRVAINRALMMEDGLG
jgi:hypothetical protein